MAGQMRYDAAFEALMVRIVAGIYEEFDAKLAALEAKLAEFAYRGQWVENKQYRRGNIVTLGSVWHAAVDTRSKPGTDSDWSLVIAKPRDGKDLVPESPAQRTAKGERSSQDSIVVRRR